MSEERKHYGGAPGQVREAAASDVKQSWHEYLERVGQGRQEIVVTRYGKPVMKLSPVDEVEASEAGFFGHLAGTITIEGDVVAPVDASWDADA